MIGRFSLYGFLKNQQYYDPFLILAFRDKGLSFAMIGVLIGFREVCTTLMEIPTGAVADVLGRRRAMIFSHLGYIAAFLIFGLSRQTSMLFAAMFFFSIGVAFRTGTHKAIIFSWLAHEGRSDEKVKVYGVTRSWAKIGSALNAVIAAAMVFFTRNYSVIFLVSVIPYLANIGIFLSYPAYLDGPKRDGLDVRGIFATLARALGHSVKLRPLRRLIVESMGFGGTFNVAKTYLQPVVETAALATPVLLGLSDRRRTAVLVGAVYVVLNLLGSVASRRSHALAERAGSPSRGARRLWIMSLAGYAALTGGFLLPVGGMATAIAAFVFLAVLQNFWRPIQVSRFAAFADPSETATVLSIESQTKSLFTAAVAPLLGLAVDRIGGDLQFLPVGAVGALVAAGILLGAARRPMEA